MPVLFDSPSFWPTSNLAVISITGEDRVSFLNNFCTNDIKKLERNSTLEAFITSIQGKCLGYVTVFHAPSSLLLITVNHKVSDLVTHLDRYIITEDVEVRIEPATECTLLAGEQIETWLQEHQPADTLVTNHWFDQPSYFLLGSLTEAQKATLVQLTDEEVQAARIQTGVPVYGADISDDNFAQEVNRDQQAISFTKGCYLGQEPIARIDALGNVHWLLARVDNQQTNAATNDILLSEGKPVAKIRSTSALTGQALAYVKRGLHESGTEIETNLGKLRIL